MKTFKVKKENLPALAEVLNRSKYDGKKVEYDIHMDNIQPTITFPVDVAGNWFHTRMEEAVLLRKEHENHSPYPYLTKRVAGDSKKVKKICKKYGSNNFAIG